MKKITKRRGFSLVEMLVATAVFLIMMTLLGSILNYILKAHQDTSGSGAAYDAVRMWSTQINKELTVAMCRKNQNRWLNLKVEDGSNTKSIFFTVPDESVTSTLKMNFVTHYVYFWREDENAIYRAVYNTDTDPQPLLATSSSNQNSNSAANQSRLTKMTLAYRSGSPYGWTSSAEMKKEMDEQEEDDAVLTRVFKFEIGCYSNPKTGPDDDGRATWSDSNTLPRFVEFRLWIAAPNQVAELNREKAKGALSESTLARLRRFVITVPLRNYESSDNDTIF